MPGDSAETSSRETDAPSGQAFEELTISEFLALMWRAPASTFRRYQRAVRSAQAREQLIPVRPPAEAADFAESEDDSRTALGLGGWPQRLRQSAFPRLALYLVAFLFALAGSAIARGTTDIAPAGGHAMQVAAPYLWLGFLLWLLADVSGDWRRITVYWQRCDRATRMLWRFRIVPIITVIGALLRLAQSLSAPRESAVDMALSALGLQAAGLVALVIINEAFRLKQRGGAKSKGQFEKEARAIILDRQPMRPPIRHAISRARLILVALASALSFAVWANTSGNRIEPRIMLVWLASIAVWALVFAPLRWNVFDFCAGAMDRARRFRLRSSRWALLALALILLLGASFRFDRLDSAPPELISDMVVNIVDAYRIQRGESYPIFLGNNGGREPFHIYLQTFISSLPGMRFDRSALLLTTALESFLTLPVMFLFAVEVMGKHRRGYALAVGLLATALLAVSFWHVVLARQGLRIPLSPLFTALSALFFARALRHNRRSDFILAGITLSCRLVQLQVLAHAAAGVRDLRGDCASATAISLAHSLEIPLQLGGAGIYGRRSFPAHASLLG